MSETIVNKVANSGLITLDLEQYLPAAPAASFDLKDHLFMGLILKEKDFREALRTLDWTPFQDKDVAIFCSVDAIIPVWAFMLVANYLQPLARNLYVGTPEEMQKHLFLQNLSAVDLAEFEGQRIVVKGCGEVPIGTYAYAEITRRLTPIARSIMYGEPCSTVPIFKKK